MASSTPCYMIILSSLFITIMVIIISSVFVQIFVVIHDALHHKETFDGTEWGVFVWILITYFFLITSMMMGAKYDFVTNFCCNDLGNCGND